MARFILGYVVFGIATMLYEWNRYFAKNVVAESFKYVIEHGDAFKGLDDNSQRVLFAISSGVALLVYGIFWPKAIYDAIRERYQKED